jgi:epoxyqueuosine reductase
MSLSSDIKEYALAIGYDRVGFTTSEKFPIYERELAERRDMYSWAI